MKKVSQIFYIIIFLSTPILMFAQTLTETIHGESTNTLFGNSVSLSSNGNILAIGASGFNSYRGQVKVYRNDNGTWSQIGETLIGDNESDSFGSSVSLSSDGSIIAIGASGFNSFRGQVKVYRNDNDTWSQIGEDLIGENESDEFGHSISVSSNANIIAIGAIGHNSFRGQVKVYWNDNDTWSQIEAWDGENETDHFGESVSLSSNGNIIAMGARVYDSSTGQVKVYQNINGIWNQVGSNLNGENEGDQFGSDIYLSSDGNTIGVAARGFNSTIGQVKIYQNNNNNWSQIGETLNGEIESDNFGFSISLSSEGSVIAIGSPSYSNTGQVKVYKNNNNNWSQVGGTLNGENEFDDFGISVSLSADGHSLAIGASSHNFHTGQVYIYDEIPVSVILIKEKKLTIYPNPTFGKLYFKDILIDYIHIQDNNGRGLKIKQNPGSFIDISDFPAGVYFLTIEVDGQQYSTKVLKK